MNDILSDIEPRFEKTNGKNTKLITLVIIFVKNPKPITRKPLCFVRPYRIIKSINNPIDSDKKTKNWIKVKISSISAMII